MPKLFILPINIDWRKPESLKHYLKSMPIRCEELVEHSTVEIPFNDNLLYVWGTGNGAWNTSVFEKMQVGDDVLLVVEPKKILRTRIRALFVDESLGRYLWGNAKYESDKYWPHIIILEEPEKTLVYKDGLKDLLGYKRNYRFQRPLIISEDKAEYILNLI